MDDMRAIEEKMQIVAHGETLAPSSVEDNQAPVSVALEATAASIVEKAQEKINSDKIVDKHAKALARNADARIANEIEKQNVANEKAKAKNASDRKEIANALFKLKQEGKRLKSEQKHLSKMQKSAQKAEKKHNYWESHKDTLEQYKMHEGSSIVACTILLFLDGVKCFFIGLSKVSEALVKAIRVFLVFAIIFAVLMLVPITRQWFLTLLGFIKK